MADSIDRISAVSAPVGSRIEAVNGYSKEGRKAALKRNEELIAAHEEITEIHRFIKKMYPNPEHLSFKECLEQELHPKNIPENEEEGFVLDIRH